MLHLNRPSAVLSSANAVLSSALQSPEEAMGEVLNVLYFVMMIAYDVAVSTPAGFGSDIWDVWLRLDTFYDWAETVLTALETAENAGTGLLKVLSSDSRAYHG